MFVHLYNGLFMGGCSTAINFPLALSYPAAARSCNPRKLVPTLAGYLLSCPPSGGGGGDDKMSHRSRCPRPAVLHGGCR